MHSAEPASAMATHPLRFLQRGQAVTLHHVAPDRTLLELLREDLGCTAVKEGCAEGDCGACTVVLGHMQGDQLRYSAVNSCIRLAHSVNGMALWTAQDLAQDPLIQPPAGTAVTAAAPSSTLHPAQEAMVLCHGSQCGFCTPGVVMSLFGMYQNHASKGQPITREMAQEALSGNLCRCTGYRPILDAAQKMASMPAMAVNEPLLLEKLAGLATPEPVPACKSRYILPTTLTELLAARSAHPTAQVVAGCTDVGLWITKQHRQHEQILDLTRVPDLCSIEQTADHIAIGAAVTLTDAFAALSEQWPQLRPFAARFASLPLRNSGTLGGNVANGSPIGDSMPLLIAIRARVVLTSLRGERDMALEDLYQGYRQNAMAPDELLLRIVVPRPTVSELLRAYKISKRFDSDISTVCLVINLDLDADGVRRASIGAGGVASTPARARQTEATLTGQPWSAETLARAAQALQNEFTPISDLRASSSYRSRVLASLLQRFWLESQGERWVSVEHFRLDPST